MYAAYGLYERFGLVSDVESEIYFNFPLFSSLPNSGPNARNKCFCNSLKPFLMTKINKILLKITLTEESDVTGSGKHDFVFVVGGKREESFNAFGIIAR